MCFTPGLGKQETGRARDDRTLKAQKKTISNSTVHERVSKRREDTKPGKILCPRATEAVNGQRAHYIRHVLSIHLEVSPCNVSKIQVFFTCWTVR